VIAVDTNIFLDIWLNDPSFATSSQQALEIALLAGEVTVAPVVVAELAAAVEHSERITNVLERMSVRLSEPSLPELVLAGQLWKDRRAGRRERIIADYLIAANAVVTADRLLTRDKDFNRIGVPGLVAITPTELIAEA
jgi:predicted nucleic acid-binding protein